MSLQSIWFLNDHLGYQENEDNKDPQKEELVVNEQSSSSSNLSSSSKSNSNLEDSLSSKDSIDLEGLPIYPTENLNIKTPQYENKAHALKVVQYLKGYEGNYKKGERRLLNGYVINKNKETAKQSISIDNLEKVDENKSNKYNDISFSSSNQAHGKDSTRGKKNKKISLVSQFRRKSCHCSDCGGISKYELKVQDVVSAHNKQIKANLIARRKMRDKTIRRINNDFLDLPNKNAVVLGANNHRGARTQTNIRKSIRKKSLQGLKISNALKTMILKDYAPRRGAETPLKMSRNSIEDKVIDVNTNKQHYIIKIFSPADTDKQIRENEKKEIPKKEQELFSPLRLQKKKKEEEKEKAEAKKAKQKNNPAPLGRRRSTILFDEPFSPTRAGFITSVSKLDFIREESNRPKVLIKMISAKSSEQTNTEITSNHSLAKQDSRKTEESIPFANTVIQKEQWKHVVLSSPKFKSTLLPKIEEEIRQNALTNGLINLESPRIATAHIQRIYTSRKATLPKLKFVNQNEGYIRQTNSPQYRCVTESHTVDNPFSSPLCTANNNNQSLFVHRRVDYHKEEAMTTKYNYDVTNSPYLKRGIQRKGTKSFALKRVEKPSIDLSKIKDFNFDNLKLKQDMNSITSKVPKLNLDLKKKKGNNESKSARIIIKNNLSPRIFPQNWNKIANHKKD